MKFMNGVAVGSALALLGTQPALGCRGPQWETSTLLHKLPSKLNEVPVVARVAIIEVLPPTFGPSPEWKFSDRVKVRVVEAVKGVEEGQILTVSSGGSSCDEAFNRKEPSLESRAYIAGKFSEYAGELLFTGKWKVDFRNSELVLVP